MIYRIAAVLCLLPSLSALSQVTNCCYDATCYYCWEVEACAELPGASPENSNSGGFANCGVDDPTTQCSSWTENYYAGADEGCVCACGDPLACNYDPVHGTDENCLSCDYSCVGCTNPMACNYTIGASIDDGSCDTLSCFGCTDTAACNYDSTATQDDGSCAPSGCLEPDACNYSAEAECDDGSCDYVCCPGPGCCLDGTVWDYSSLGCVVANPSDVDLDGCTGVGDVLEVLATFGQCYDDSENEGDGVGGNGFNPSNSIPESYYTDPEVLLLLDFEGMATDNSPLERNVTLSSYQLGADRFGNPNAALHPMDEMLPFVQGDCSDVVVNGETPTNCLAVDPPVAILSADNDEYAISMWIEHPNIVYSEGCYQSIWTSLLYGLVPIYNPPSGNVTVCYYASNLSFSLENWGWDGQACPYSSLGLSGWGLQGASWSGDTCFLASAPPQVLPQHPYLTGWNHLVVSKSNNQIQTYVNGEMQWAATLNEDEQDSFRHYGAIGFPDITISDHDLVVELIRGLRETVGQRNSYYAIDDILVLNRALSIEEVSDLYSPGSTTSVEGCTSCDACNYNGTATSDNGTCDYSCYGCLDPEACNYESNATLSDYSCYFPGDTCSDGDPLTCGDVYTEACECLGIVPLDSVGAGPCAGLESVSYFGYDYALTEICDQCWFAENLKTSQFQNGDAIPTGCGTGNNSTQCSGLGFSLTIPDYGGQYNYWAYTDDRGLCPSGFHVPSLEDWQELNAAVITALPAGETVANALRGTISDFPAWSGSDLFGFKAIPAGSNCHTGNLGTFGEFATSSVVESAAWNAVHGISINDYGSGLGGVTGGVNNGWCRNVSVRCVKN